MLTMTLGTTTERAAAHDRALRLHEELVKISALNGQAMSCPADSQGLTWYLALAYPLGLSACIGSLSIPCTHGSHAPINTLYPLIDKCRNVISPFVQNNAEYITVGLDNAVFHMLCYGPARLVRLHNQEHTIHFMCKR
jgi:hypothetical protein